MQVAGGGGRPRTYRWTVVSQAGVEQQQRGSFFGIRTVTDRARGQFSVRGLFWVRSQPPPVRTLPVTSSIYSSISAF